MSEQACVREVAGEVSTLRIAGPAIRSARYQRWILIGTLVVSDALVMSLALWAAWYIRIGSGWLAYYSEGPLDVYLRAIVVAVPMLLCIFLMSGLYDFRLLLGGTREYEAIVRACAYGVVALVFVSFMWRELVLSRGWLLLSWSLAIILVSTSRFIWRRVFQRLRRVRGWFVTPTLIVGANSQGCAIADQISQQNAGMDIVGFVDDFLAPGTEIADGKVVLGVSSQLHELATAHGVRDVIVIQNAVSWETYRDILQQATQVNDFDLLLSPGFYEILATGVQVKTGGFVPLLLVEKARITGIDRVFKTALDVTLGVLLLIVTLPITLFSGIALWLSVGNPVLHRYEVVGLGGRPFRTTKFRSGLHGTSYRRLSGTTLSLDSDREDHSWVGSLLYCSGLDKLPQLLDVVQGRMSLVGPRARSPQSGVRLENEAPDLLTLKPGWTGLWAVGEARSLEDETRLDMHYVRNWTIWLDLQILFTTAKLVIARRSRTAADKETSQVQ